MGTISPSARGRAWWLAVLCLGASLLVPWTPRAAASTSQMAILQDGSLNSNPGAELLDLRHLGVRIVRVFVRWSDFAPQPNSPRRPHFNATDPASYSAATWGPYDEIVRDAAADNMGVLLAVTAAAPKWADGPGEPAQAAKSVLYAWYPSPVQFGQFYRAVATRYSGHYVPCGPCGALPAVRYWEIYNEPNFGQDLGPQASNNSSYLIAPRLYRAILAAGWSALMATGHSHDTILMGGLAARGSQAPPGRFDPQGLPGQFGISRPLSFLRDLYCLTSRYRPYRGAAARLRGCPASKAASRRFRSQNPALFKLKGVAIHPYPLAGDSGLPPNRTTNTDPDNVTFPMMGEMAHALDRMLRAYGSGARLGVWDTEFGYLTNPPNHSGAFPSPANQAYYLNWAEYLSWRNARVQSFMQYLLEDPNPVVGTPEYGGFASGLEFYGGQPKPSYAAWILPLFLPGTTQRLGHGLQVWGCVRPAYYAFLDTHRPQQATIQFQRAGTSAWTAVRTLTFTNSNCYFDVTLAFPASGTVRLSYSYPPTDAKLSATTVAANGYVNPLAPALSRSVSITVK
jgi:hypothetical protein